VSVQSGVREPALQRCEQTLNFVDPGMYQHELSRWLTAAQVGLLQSIQRPCHGVRQCVQVDELGLQDCLEEPCLSDLS